MSYLRFWRYWLLGVSVFITAFGMFMALLNHTILFSFFNTQINPVFWGSTPVPSPAQAFQAWIYGAWGATVMGWGITMIFIAYYPFGQQERWAWKAVLVSVLAWYIIDTTISWLFVVIINVIFNTTILILVIIPLLLTGQEMSN
ncbi:MAG: hypothetical protein ACFE8O_09570 [Candidatus Hermodarchaeota archaeon]